MADAVDLAVDAAVGAVLGEEDRLEVVAGAERPPGAGDHEAAHGVVAAHLLDGTEDLA